MVIPTDTRATTLRPPSAVEHRHHRAHRRPQGAGVLLGERRAVGRRAEVPDERLADLVAARGASSGSGPGPSPRRSRCGSRAVPPRRRGRCGRRVRRCAAPRAPAGCRRPTRPPPARGPGRSRSGSAGRPRRPARPRRRPPPPRPAPGAPGSGAPRCCGGQTGSRARTHCGTTAARGPCEHNEHKSDHGHRIGCTRAEPADPPRSPMSTPSTHRDRPAAAPRPVALPLHGRDRRRPPRHRGRPGRPRLRRPAQADRHRVRRRSSR